MLICVYGTRISVIMFQLLIGYVIADASGEPDTDRMKKDLSQIKDKLTAKEGSRGKIKPGSSI